MPIAKEDLEAVIQDAPADEPTPEELEAEFLAAFDLEDDVPNIEQVEDEPAIAPADEPAPKEGDAEGEEEVEDPAQGDDKDPKVEDAPGEKPEEEPLTDFQALENRLGARMRKVEGHIGGLKSQLQTALANLAASESEEFDTPTKRQISAATGKRGSTEKLDKLRDEFPEWADALDELAANYTGGETTDVPALREEFQQTVYETTKVSAARMRELIKVDIAHPGWEETRVTPEFTYWRDSQPEEIQTLAASPKAADAIKMLDLYKEATATKAPANKASTTERLRRSVAPTTATSAPPARTPTEEEDFIAAFNGS